MIYKRSNRIDIALDKTDIMLSLILLANSRTPYHELADKLGLSINAVHKRIKAMTEVGIIRAYTARINLAMFKALSIWIFGRSEVRPFDEVHLRLQNNDSTYWVAYSGGGHIYVGAYIQEIAQLEQYVTFVKKETQMVDPVVGILSPPPTFLLPFQNEKFYPLDYKIIRALQKDAKKPVLEVANELGVSTKVVQRHLKKLMEKNLVELSIEWYPDASNDIMSICHLQLTTSADKEKLSISLMEEFAPNLLFCISFSNLPDLLICFLWTNTMKELKGIRERLGKVEGVESTILNVLYTGFIFDTWRDKLVIEKSSQGKDRSN